MRRSKRRTAGERPVWASPPIDAAPERIHPYPGWILLDEQFHDRTRLVGGVELVIARPYDRHTMYAEVMAISDEDSEEYGISTGDVVIFKEWAGGRWLFRDQEMLLSETADILGIVEKVASSE